MSATNPRATSARRRWRPAAAVAIVAVAVAACSGGEDAAPSVPSLPPRSVGGFLFQDRNGDGVRDSGERLLSGWAIGVYGTGPLALEEATTADDGSFRFDDVQVGTEPGVEVRLKFSPVLEGPASLEAPTQLHQTVTMPLGSAGPVAVSSYKACTQVEACAGLALPDLRPLLEVPGGSSDEYPGTEQWRLDTETQPGRVLMRFGTMTVNDGPGILHVIGLDPNTEADTQPVEQRIYGDGFVFPRRAGEFVYHPEHHHIHMGDFESYRLVDPLTDAVVAESSKVSFCLTDVIPVAPAAVEAPIRLDLVPFECGAVEQGINPGWADYYGPELPDQWIDVTDVPSGDYVIRLDVDPADSILEADETNNRAELPITYVNPLR